MSSFRKIAYILSSTLLGFVGFIIVGEGITGLSEGPPKLTHKEIMMFGFMGMSLLGFIVVFIRQLIGALLTVLGSLAFIITESMSEGSLWSVSDGFMFYLILLAGILHLISWKLWKMEKSGEIEE